MKYLKLQIDFGGDISDVIKYPNNLLFQNWAICPLLSVPFSDGDSIYGHCLSR